MSPEKTPTDANVYQIKVTLKGIKPPIWRRIQVTGNTTLAKLHHILQAVMGWDDYHLHQFTIRGTQYGEPDPDFGSDVKSERRVKLSQVVTKVKDKFLYEYDFGDGWEHELLVEKIEPPQEGARYPVCLVGKRACPPEDCGGHWGYGDFVAAIRNPNDPEHESMLEWVGGEYDPEEFDLEEVNRELAKMR